MARLRSSPIPRSSGTGSPRSDSLSSSKAPASRVTKAYARKTPFSRRTKSHLGRTSRQFEEEEEEEEEGSSSKSKSPSEDGVRTSSPHARSIRSNHDYSHRLREQSQEIDESSSFNSSSTSPDQHEHTTPLLSAQDNDTPPTRTSSGDDSNHGSLGQSSQYSLSDQDYSERTAETPSPPDHEIKRRSSFGQGTRELLHHEPIEEDPSDESYVEDEDEGVDGDGQQPDHAPFVFNFASDDGSGHSSSSDGRLYSSPPPPVRWSSPSPNVEADTPVRRTRSGRVLRPARSSDQEGETTNSDDESYTGERGRRRRSRNREAEEGESGEGDVSPLPQHSLTNSFSSDSSPSRDSSSSGPPSTPAPSPVIPAAARGQCNNEPSSPHDIDRNPFYRRPVPGGPAKGPWTPVQGHGVYIPAQTFNSTRYTPLPSMPDGYPTTRCATFHGAHYDTIRTPGQLAAPLRPVPFFHCAAHLVLGGHPFNMNLPHCSAYICDQCNQRNRHNFEMIKEAANLGICKVCLRREKAPVNEDCIRVPTNRCIPSWNCACQPYPAVESRFGLCAAHIELYAEKVQERACLVIDYRRQIQRNEGKKKNYNRKPPRVRPPGKHLGLYYKHMDPPNSLAPHPPTLAHPRNETGWYAQPRCPCGRVAAHARKGWPRRDQDPVRSCVLCPAIPGDLPDDVSNPRPMTVGKDAAGRHINAGVRPRPKNFPVGHLYAGQNYGTEGWVRRR